MFSNEDVAKDFLQEVLKISIEKISVVGEATTQEDPFHKSVRFDVMVKEEVPEASGKPGVGRMFDIDILAKGVSYANLQEQFILFICPDDVFGKGKPVYSFQNREDSDPNILMGDLCYKKFYIFNKYGEVEDESTREYMRYFATKTCESEKMKRIHNLVQWYRQDPATRKAYMTLEQELNIRYEKGVAEGFAVGVDSAKKELAKAFRDAGVSLEIIAKQNGLSPEEIKAM